MAQSLRVRVVNVTRGTVLAEEAQIASSFFARGWGLLGCRGLHPGEGLILRPCNAIHTFFMRFSIDVVFADRQGRVKAVFCGVKPFRAVLPVPGARWALELPAGAVASSGTRRGDVLREEEKGHPSDSGELSERLFLSD
ncbi:MAG: DUF192 domain-containing protein [Bacillota bacterium]|nr:DUF192 domain-containing protein [Bacillota bacterium]